MREGERGKGDSLSLPLSLSLVISEIMIGFDKTMYQVNELVDSIEVCVSVIGGAVLDRRVVVQYRTLNKRELGMEYVFVCDKN